MHSVKYYEVLKLKAANNDPRAAKLAALELIYPDIANLLFRENLVSCSGKSKKTTLSLNVKLSSAVALGITAE